MECDAQRAAVDAGVKDVPCQRRRQILGGLATLAATAAIPQMATAHDQYEAALHYLHSEFMDAAGRLGRSDDKAYDTLYRRMLSLATALSVIPATPRVARLKHEVAAWSYKDGLYTVILPPDLTAALMLGVQT